MPRSTTLKPCQRRITSIGQHMSPEWRTIDDQRLPCLANYPLVTQLSIKKRHEDCRKMSITACYANHLCWSDMVADHGAWRHSILNAVDEFEEHKRRAKGQQKQEERSSHLQHHTGRHFLLWTLLRVLHFPHRNR